MIDSILFLNDTLANIQKNIQPLFVTKRFLLIHAEVLIHSHRLRVAVSDIWNDINKFGKYLDTLSSGKLSPTLVNPIHLCDELLGIQRELPPTIELPENPAYNIWHYYKHLTVSFVPHADKIILLIRLLLVDSDSTVTLYKVYNLPIVNQHIGKSLKYNLQENYLAITNDNNYATIPSEYEFIECTLASGHFCNLKNALYHMHSLGWCLTSLFLKNDRMIETNCRMSLTNVTGLQAIYLDQGNWAVATVKSDQMEISCNSHRHVITIEPPLTLVNLQPGCSAFSAKIKLPPYCKKYSKGFAIAIKAANLHPDKFSHVDFCIWKSFNVSSLSTIQKSNLNKLDLAPSVPVNKLWAKIESLKVLNLDSKGKFWFYITGGGTGSDVLLLVIVMMCVLEMQGIC